VGVSFLADDNSRDKKAVSVARDGSVKLRDPWSGTSVPWRLEDLENLSYSDFVPGRQVTNIAFSHTGRTAVVSREDGELWVFENNPYNKGAWLGRIPAKPETGATSSVAVSPGALELVSGTTTGEVIVWSRVPGAKWHLRRSLATKHSDAILAMALTLDGKKAITASRDGEICESELGARAKTDPLTLSLGHRIGNIAVIARPPRALVADESGRISLWDVEKRKELWGAAPGF
jgi:WD40 repeat protein